CSSKTSSFTPNACAGGECYKRPAAMGGALRRSGRLWLAARPDQVVRTVLVLDQPGIDRCRERRIVEGHGQVVPPGLAGLLPRRADVVAGGLEAEVGGVLAAALVVGNQLDLDVERQGAQRAGEAVFVGGEGADVGHDDFSFRLNKVRAHRVLVVIRPAGDGLAAPLAVATQWSAGRRKEFVARGSRVAAGKLFSPGGCSQKPEAQPRPRQDSQRDKAALGRTASKGDGADSASSHEGCTGARPDTGQDNAPTTKQE